MVSYVVAIVRYISIIFLFHLFLLIYSLSFIVNISFSDRSFLPLPSVLLPLGCIHSTHLYRRLLNHLVRVHLLVDIHDLLHSIILYPNLRVLLLDFLFYPPLPWQGLLTHISPVFHGGISFLSLFVHVHHLSLSPSISMLNLVSFVLPVDVATASLIIYLSIAIDLASVLVLMFRTTSSHRLLTIILVDHICSQCYLLFSLIFSHFFQAYHILSCLG